MELNSTSFIERYILILINPLCLMKKVKVVRTNNKNLSLLIFHDRQ